MPPHTSPAVEPTTDELRDRAIHACVVDTDRLVPRVFGPGPIDRERQEAARGSLDTQSERFASELFGELAKQVLELVNEPPPVFDLRCDPLDAPSARWSMIVS